MEGTSGQTAGLWRARIDPTTLHVSDIEPVTVGASRQSGFRLSHDGRSAVFVVSHARYHIWSFPFDAATGRVGGGESLYEDVQSSDCALSRDGARLACHAAEGLWVGDLRARTRAPLFADQAANRRGALPNLSPDGQHIAYQRGAAGDAPSGVYVATIDGRDEHLVRPHVPRISFPYGWSPDGRWVVGTTRRARRCRNPGLDGARLS
jgi:sugar lactone lactonase YvrE